MKKYILLFLAVVFSLGGQAQDLEHRIFARICEGITQEETESALTKKLQKQFENRIMPLIDPVGGIYSFMYKDSTEADIVAFKQQYSFKERYDLLTASTLTAFPLNDTVDIIDENSFFSPKLEFKGTHYFRCLNGLYYADTMNHSIFYLKKVILRQNTLTYPLNLQKKGYGCSSR